MPSSASTTVPLFGFNAIRFAPLVVYPVSFSLAGGRSPRHCCNAFVNCVNLVNVRCMREKKSKESGAEAKI